MDPVTYTLARGASSNQTLYVEDVFSIDLYSGYSAGTGSLPITYINNGINLQEYGGLIWTTRNPSFVTQENGLDNYLTPLNSGTPTALSSTGAIVSFTSSGYTLSGSGNTNNGSGQTYISYTFRKAAKFFDIVTYTGNGTSQNIKHNLDTTPGFIAVKRTDATGNWVCWHKDLIGGLPTGFINMNTSGGLIASPSYTGFPWNATLPTSTGFSVGSLGSSGVASGNLTNISGAVYVAYIFADGSGGGFGEDGTENIIKCGSYTGGGAFIDIGFEPALLIVKAFLPASPTSGVWMDLRKFNNGLRDGITDAASFSPSVANLDLRDSYFISSGHRNVGGFSRDAIGGNTYMYIAIRNELMRPPINASSVFNVRLQTPSTVTGSRNLGIRPDAVYATQRNNNSAFGYLHSRVLGHQDSLSLNVVLGGTTGASVNSGILNWGTVDGVFIGNDSNNTFQRTFEYVHYVFKKAASFYDQGIIPNAAPSGVRSVRHDLRVPPELLIIKNPYSVVGTISGQWFVYSKFGGSSKYLSLSTASGFLNTSGVSGLWGDTNPTSTGFTFNPQNTLVQQPTGVGNVFIYQAFASCPGVSTISSYTGTAQNLDINCGFTNGARFVMIKRTDSGTSGDWYVWDTARGIIPSSDPYSRWNLLTGGVTGEVNNTDFIDAYSSGFTITNTATGTVNISGAVYLFMAIA